MTAPRRAQRLLLLGAVVTLSSTMGLAPARAELSFDAVATAYGNLVTLDNPSIPLGVSVFETAPESRARLTSLGESSALAAGPYLGDTLTNFVFAQPGANGLGETDYPLVVSTLAGEEPKDRNAPGVALHAESGLSLALATANLGQPSSGSTSRSRAELTQDGLTTTAETSSDGLVLFDKVQLGAVSARATTVVDSSGRRTSTARMTIAHLSATGLSITVPKAVPAAAPAPLGGTPIPPPLGGMRIAGPDLGVVDGAFTVTIPGLGPQRYAVPAQAVEDGLKAIGVTMRFQAAQRTPTGIVAPTVTFGTVLPAPPSNAQYHGPTPVTVTFGRASTSVTAHPLPAAATPTFTGTGDLAGDAPPSTAVAPPQLGSVPLPGAGSGAAPVTAAGPAQVAPAYSTPLVNTGAAPPADLSQIYVLLVAVAVVAFTSATVLRVLGVRNQWAS
jgi:hypothetical protein